MAKAQPKIVVRSSNGIKGKQQPWLNYLMIAAIVVLLAFSVVYIYNIMKGSLKKEGFESGKKVDVILIYSDGCGHCQKFKPIFDNVTLKKGQLFTTSGMTINFSKYSTASDEASKYMSEVNGVPTTLVQVDGKIAAKIVGFREEQVFIDELKKTLQV
jgi:thiol-disulfide isomerase/thioredoxin